MALTWLCSKPPARLSCTFSRPASSWTLPFISLLTDLFGSLSPVAVSANTRLERLICFASILPTSGVDIFSLNACSGCFKSTSSTSPLLLNDWLLPCKSSSVSAAINLPISPSRLALIDIFPDATLSWVKVKEGISRLAAKLSLALIPLADMASFLALNSCVARLALALPDALNCSLLISSAIPLICSSSPSN